MEFTAQLQDNRVCKNDGLNGESRWVVSLCVNGTTDTLRGLAYLRTRTVCKCCGSKSGPFVLNDAGRRKLKQLRRAKEANQ